MQGILRELDDDWTEDDIDSIIVEVCNKPMVFILDGCSFNYRTYGVNQEFRSGKGIWLHRKSRQIRKFVWKRPIFILFSIIIPAQHVLSYRNI